MPINKRGHVWIETVLYTLIALVLIGVALAFITPKINEAKDKAAVEQAISMLNVLDERLNSALVAPGNVRVVDILLKKGDLEINPAEDSIKIILSDLKKPYSEVGVPIKNGRVTIVSVEGQKSNSVELSLNYTNWADITYKGTTNLKKFNPSATSYSISIENKGANNGISIINMDEITGK